MTLLAHWKLNDRPIRDAHGGVAYDSGSAGRYSGVYTFISSGGLFSGGAYGRYFYASSHWTGGISKVHTWSNIAELRLQDEMTISAWVHPQLSWDTSYGFYSENIVGVIGVDETEVENDPWRLSIDAASLRMSFMWEHGLGTDVIVYSSNNILARLGWIHIVAVRYLVAPGMYGIRYYQDGVLFSTHDNGGVGYSPPTGGGNSLGSIGPIISGVTTMNSISSVRVYNHAMLDTEVTALHDEESVGVYRQTVIETGVNSPEQDAGFKRL